MDKYQVKINPKAISELDYIYNYIAIEKSASENARAQINRIKNAILGLDTVSVVTVQYQGRNI